MSTAGVVAIVVVVVVVAAIVAAVMLMRDQGGARLKSRFGPEYDRTLARHDGDRKAARQELSERVKRYGGLDRPALGAEDKERYTAAWKALQARFVDEPGAAVTGADRLLGRLAAERGFPGPESPEHFDALSVHHPHQVQGYRRARALAEQDDDGGRRGTEDLRQALVAARGLFDEMTQDGPGTTARRPLLPAGRKDAAAEDTTRDGTRDTTRYGTGVDARDGATAAPATAPEPEPTTGRDADSADSADDGDDRDGDAAHDGTRSRKAPFADRFAALTGGGTRKER